MKNLEEEVAALRMTVERRFGAGVNTPAEFNRLSEDIGVRIGVSLSASTLMRVWGYVASAARPNMSTLNTLARYAGYRDFRQLVDNGGIDREASEDVVSPRITVADDLVVRDRVRLTWQPDRECVVRYLGGGQFVVEQALATKLHPGDTFSCALIIEGEPLYLDNLVRAGNPPVAFVCGKRSGVRFEKLSLPVEEEPEDEAFPDPS